MRILLALIRKEIYQIIRDPSALIIAFVLPVILLFIFGYGINLDSNRVRLGIVLEDNSPVAQSLAQAFVASPYIDASVAFDRRDFYKDLTMGDVRGVVIIPHTFSKDVLSATTQDIQGGLLQVIADGSEPNIAEFVQNYSVGIFKNWQQGRGQTQVSRLQALPRFWYNQELRSRNFLVPGAIAIVMTLVGTLLTAFVVAREWERGTMEALMATPVSIFQILVGKLIPYFILGYMSLAICFVMAVFIYDVPFRGSYTSLIGLSGLFLSGALGQGLFISSIAKNQFIASQLALVSGFLPAFMLSGFIFEISSMPYPIQILTHIFPARYFVSCLQTLFLVGDVKEIFYTSSVSMALLGGFFFVMAAKKNRKDLE